MLESWASVAVEKVLDVRVGVLLQRLGQNELKVEAEKQSRLQKSVSFFAPIANHFG